MPLSDSSTKSRKASRENIPGLSENFALIFPGGITLAYLQASISTLLLSQTTIVLTKVWLQFEQPNIEH